MVDRAAQRLSVSPRRAPRGGNRSCDLRRRRFAVRCRRHTQYTIGWIEFGLQFREVLRDQPAVTIPDDHDVGHPNLWGAGGKRALDKNGSDGVIFPNSLISTGTKTGEEPFWEAPPSASSSPQLWSFTLAS